MNLADGGKHERPMWTTYVLHASHSQGCYRESMVQANRIPEGLKTVQTKSSLWSTTQNRFLRNYSMKTRVENTTPNLKCLKEGNCCEGSLLAS